MKEIDLERMFTYHPATGMQPGLYGAVRAKCLDLAKLINSVCPDCPEKEQAIWRLNDVMFYANASIARCEDEKIVQNRTNAPEY